MVKTLNELNFGFAGAIISGISMLLLGIFGNLGVYTGAVNSMMERHMFFSLSFSGVIFGIIEGTIIGFIAFYFFALIYNKLDDKK